MFQSSPDPKAGCNHNYTGAPAAFSLVSILTRPEGRVQPLAKAVSPGISFVSILTRPEGRVQQFARQIQLCWISRFNPHPTRRPGATFSPVGIYSPRSLFQSSPDPKAG